MKKWTVNIHGGSVLLAAALMLVSQPALAHWCSNIWTSPARILVKPEKSTVIVSSSGTQLRVYLQNNYPYKLFGVQLRGGAPGYSISVSPSSQDVNPGQNVSFIFNISGSGSLVTSTMSIEMNWRPGRWPSSWWSKTHAVLDQNPSQSYTLSRSQYSGSRQEASLSAMMLAQKYPSATLPSSSPYFGRTGLQQVIHWFGYRFCYSSSGYWRCGSNNCPTSSCNDLTQTPWTSTVQFPQNCIRAGAEVAALHARAKLGSQLSAARAAAINSLKGNGSTMHKCMGAVVGAYIYRGVSNTTPFTSVLNNSSNGVPTVCRNAANRILTGSPGSNCTSGNDTEKAACAAAEGLRDNDGPVKSVLINYAGDGYQPSGGNYKSLYYAYMLYIVTEHRMAKTGYASYYPDAGGTGGVVKDTGPPPDLPPQPRCGDGVKNGTDQCDGTDLGGQTCRSYGFDGGTLTCRSNCTFNTNACYKCGDGVKNGTEKCDGTDLGGQTCKTQGFASGTLFCSGTCNFDTSACSTCGDNKIDTGEQCDGTALGGRTCQSLGFSGGTLRCRSNCNFNTDGCTTLTCGNGKIDGSEQCDGTLMGGKTCKTQGFDGGTISCRNNCTLNTDSCFKCGDNKINGSEQCDGARLGGKTCRTQGFDGGTLRCSSNCTFNTGGCFKCGDGKINGSEQCDGAALGGKTCKSLGLPAGPLKCKASCIFDTSQCGAGPTPDKGVATPDKGVPSRDTGGTTADKGGTGGDGAVTPPDREGCNCELGQTSSRPPALPLLALGLLLAVRLRRRRE